MPRNKQSTASPMSKEMVAVMGLAMDLARRLAQMESRVQRLADTVGEIKENQRIVMAPIPPGAHCSSIMDGGIVLYGVEIRLSADLADVLFHLANTDAIMAKEDLAVVCESKNTRMQGEHLVQSSVYQRLRRLRIALNKFFPKLGTQCILSIRRGKTNRHDYRFDRERFRAMLGIE